MATSLARTERTLLDRYDELESIHGVHLTSQLSPRIGDPGQVMARLRDNPPGKLGGLTVQAASDYLAAADLPPSDVLSYRLTGARVVVRPSGTEPKIKAYLQVTEEVSPAGLAAARSAATRRMAPLRDAVAALVTP
jgi:phosphomannomutase